MPKLIKERNVSYVNRDFNSLKRDLIRMAQAHHSGSFSDFNESSPGMVFLEFAAYVGDVLSFYQDQQFNETKMSTATDYNNVVAFAKMKGYRPSGPRAARGKLAVAVEVPSSTDQVGARVPDPLYCPILVAGSQAAGPNGTTFETLENTFFSSSLGRDVVATRFDSSGMPSYFALRKYVDIVAGQTVTETFSITEFKKFRSIELSNRDVIEIIDVVDSDGNIWYEVPYLAQSFVFASEDNNGSDNEQVPYRLSILSVPRRFQTDRDSSTGKTSLIFGSGDGVNFDDELVPNLADFALPLAGRSTFSSFALDPRNFLKTRSFGLSPYNTSLTIRYRIGGGENTNVPDRSIRSMSNATLSFQSTNLDPQKKADVESSLSCNNDVSTDGGAPAETITEIKLNADAFYASQSRVVTEQDFISRVFSLPAKFGKVAKVSVSRNPISHLSTDMFILSKDSNGHLAVASSTLKNNIKGYIGQFRMSTEGINIFDGKILNVRCNFGVVVSSKLNKSEVLTKCIDVIRSRFDVDLIQMSQPIVLSELTNALHSVNGVISVYELYFSNVIGLIDSFSYSSQKFDVGASTRNGIIYCPNDSIIEIKYPNRDIIGVAK